MEGKQNRSDLGQNAEYNRSLTTTLLPRPDPTITIIVQAHDLLYSITAWPGDQSISLRPSV